MVNGAESGYILKRADYSRQIYELNKKLEKYYIITLNIIKTTRE